MRFGTDLKDIFVGPSFRNCLGNQINLQIIKLVSLGQTQVVAPALVESFPNVMRVTDEIFSSQTKDIRNRII